MYFLKSKMTQLKTGEFQLVLVILKMFFTTIERTWVVEVGAITKQIVTQIKSKYMQN